MAPDILLPTESGRLPADSAAGGRKSPNVARRVAAVLAILIGACIGALLVSKTGLAVPLALAGLVTLAATLGLARDAASDQ